MTGTTFSQLVDVHLLDFPVPLAAKAKQHFEELMREFALIHAGASDDHDDDRPVPARLMELIDTLTTRFAGVNSAAEERLERAIAEGVPVIDDHVMTLPPEAAPATVALGAMIDEADEYCRQGEHLLTMATPPDCVAYRKWYLGEVAGQLDGAAPTPWPGLPSS